MTENNFLLTYRYTDSTVKVTVMADEKELYDIDVCGMLRMSVSRPWNLERMKFDIVDIADEDNVLTVLAENGTFMVMLTISLLDTGDLSIEAEWKNTSSEPLCDLMLGIAIPVKAEAGSTLIIPPMHYDKTLDDNGQLCGEFLAGGGYIAEEHRFPIPAVALTDTKHNSWPCMGLFSYPSRVLPHETPDNEWSLGVVQKDGVVLLTMLSGGVMLDGKKDTILGGSNTEKEYSRGYFTLEPGTSVVKKFIVGGWSTGRDSEDLDTFINRAIRYFKPKSTVEVSTPDYVKYKGIALKNRFYESPTLVGYINQLAQVEDTSAIHYGTVGNEWTVENLCAAWCDALYSLQTGMKAGIMRAKHCVDFFINNSKCKKKGLRQLYYSASEDKWKFSKSGDMVFSGEFGRMLTYLADIIILFKEHCLEIPEEWIDALEDGCDFLCGFRKLTKTGLFPTFWNSNGGIDTSEISANGISCVNALLKAYTIMDDHHYLSAAAKILANYELLILSRHKLILKNKKLADVNVLDCDKQAFSQLLVAAVNCHRITNDDKYIKIARNMADRLLLYVYFVSHPLVKGTAAGRAEPDIRGISRTGITEHCVDMFFPSYELRQVGEVTQDIHLKQIAEMTLHATTQHVSTGNGEYGLMAVGENPDYLYFSNWSHSASSEEYRGGYGNINSIKALVLPLYQVLKYTGNNRI